MSRRSAPKWATEELHTDIPTIVLEGATRVPPCIDQGAVSDNMHAPETGALYEHPDVKKGETEELEQTFESHISSRTLNTEMIPNGSESSESDLAEQDAQAPGVQVDTVNLHEQDHKTPAEAKAEQDAIDAAEAEAAAQRAAERAEAEQADSVTDEEDTAEESEETSDTSEFSDDMDIEAEGDSDGEDADLESDGGDSDTGELESDEFGSTDGVDSELDTDVADDAAGDEEAAPVDSDAIDDESDDAAESNEELDDIEDEFEEPIDGNDEAVDDLAEVELDAETESGDELETETEVEDEESDAEQVEVAPGELVEESEIDLDSKEADADFIDEAGEALFDDKEELEEANKVATESLKDNGLQNAALFVFNTKLNKSIDRWRLDVPSLGSESADQLSNVQRTEIFVQQSNIALEGMASKLTNWFANKITSTTDYITSAGNVGKAGLKDHKRKADRIGSLPADWRSKGGLKAPKRSRSFGDTPVKIAKTIKQVAGGSFGLDSILDSTSQGGIKALKSLTGARIVKGKNSDLGRASVEKTPDDHPIEMLDIGAGYTAFSLKSEVNLVTNEKLASPITWMYYTDMESKTKETLDVASKRDLEAILDAYFILSELLVKSGDSMVQAVASFQPKLNDLNAALADGDEVKAQNLWPEVWNIVAACMVYNKAMTRIARGLKDTINVYLTNPDKK